MMTIEQLQANLASTLTAIDSNVLVVKFPGRMVSYRDMDALKNTRDLLASDLAKRVVPILETLTAAIESSRSVEAKRAGKKRVRKP